MTTDRRHLWARSARFVAFALMVASSPREAAASPVEDCAHAAEQTQALRDGGKLVDARRQAILCQRESCPAFIRTDCERWSVELEANLPTIVFRAGDDSGVDRNDVEVFIEGRLLVSRLNGIAVAVDPGVHHLTFRMAGRVDVQQDLLIVQGEKNRRVLVTFAPLQRPTPASSPRKTTTSAGPLPWVFGGVAGVALASFGYFGIRAIGKKDAIESSCGPKHACPHSDKDALFTTALAADISLGVSLLASAGALWFALRAPGLGDVVITPTVHGAAAQWTLSY